MKSCFLSFSLNFFKISSYELLWDKLLIECAKTNKPVIISTGMATLNEVSRAVKILKKTGNKKITVMHCLSVYPADFKTLHKGLQLNVKLPNEAAASDLLSFLNTKGSVNHFVELVPSANDIFIQTVDKTNQ